jgi:hypothetical protein
LELPETGELETPTACRAPPDRSDCPVALGNLKEKSYIWNS